MPSYTRQQQQQSCCASQRPSLSSMQPHVKQRAAVLTLVLLSSTLLAACHARPAPTAHNTTLKPLQQQQPQRSMPERGQQQQQQQADAFAAAPSCRSLPTAAASSPDKAGRLWGQLSPSGTACAYKDGQGHALLYAGYEPGSWLHTPACSAAPFSPNSVTDSKLRTWGWEQQSGSLCAFKDDQQLAIPPQQTYTMLAWPEAPACMEQPQPSADNAVPDVFGCLWGWQLDRNCAFRDAATGQPLYWAGFSGSKCDVEGSVRRAAEFNANTGNAARNPAASGPGAVTGMGCVGQKRNGAAPGNSSRAPCTETTVPVTFGPGSA